MKGKTSKLANEDIKFRSSIDGIWDMCIGLAFIVAGIAFQTETVAVASGFYLPIFFLMVVLKKKTVYPRIGYVKHQGMDIKTRKVMTVTLIIGMVMLMAASLLYLNIAKGENSEAMRNIAQNYGGIILGIIIAFIIVLLGKTFGVSRFYIYSPLVFLAFLAIKLIDYDQIISISFLICGGIILLVGLTFYIKFIRTYPRLGDEENE